MNISHYQNILFDCDGVLLNSNKVKTLGFYQSVLPWGEIGANLLVKYHLDNGGISRYKKFSFYLQDIYPLYGDKSLLKPDLNNLCQNYASYIKQSMLNCQCSPNLKELRSLHRNQDWYVISGGDQIELRYIFSERNLSYLFNGGIFGSPDDKLTILTRLFNQKVLHGPCLFIGDSKYDYMVAKHFNIDFLFASYWSDVENWQEFVEAKNISTISSLSVLN